MASERASTLESTLTMRSSLSRRATRSKLTGRRSQRSLTVKPARARMSRTTSIKSARATPFDVLDFYKKSFLPPPGLLGRAHEVGRRHQRRLAVGGVGEAGPDVVAGGRDAE